MWSAQQRMSSLFCGPADAGGLTRLNAGGASLTRRAFETARPSTRAATAWAATDTGAAIGGRGARRKPRPAQNARCRILPSHRRVDCRTVLTATVLRKQKRPPDKGGPLRLARGDRLNGAVRRYGPELASFRKTEGLRVRRYGAEPKAPSAGDLSIRPDALQPPVTSHLYAISPKG
jgi:hypothetical protein